LLRLRWRKNIHPVWTRGPLLYLDAAGAGGFELGRAWFRDLRLAVEATARAPHMRVTQLVDTQLGYSTILPNRSPSGERNTEAVARVI
jgi:hypothetical protein